MSPDTPPHQPEWLDTHQPSMGRYVLGPILGQGGAGEVREAWDVVLCRTVALKVLRKMEPMGLIRFMHEAQIQSRMVHPNICRVYDVDSSGGIPKLAMQLVRGPTLAQAAHELTVQEVVTILAQVAEAIHAAHRMQLIHRDLKPSNILLERGAEGQWVPFVCDFGLAMALDEPSLTLGPGLLGTLAFMAPEQLQGERWRVGPATDVYALGCTLHCALFGEAPGAARPLVLPRLGVFPPARSPSPDLPRDLETILRKCLELEPNLRYASAQALAEDLWLFRDGAPIHARPVGAVQRGWRRSRPYRPLILLALLAGAGILAGRLVEKGQLTRDQRTQAEWTRFFVLEAADLEKDVRLEKMMPIHDMRPAYARLRARMAAIRTRMLTQGPEAQGPGHYALGSACFMLKDFPGARKELEQAWALGFRVPESAWLLARSLVGCSHQATDAALFDTGLPPPDAAAVARRAQELFRLGRGGEGDSAQFAEALLAYTLRDYPRAAACAHASFLAHPWHYESATIESLSFSALGRQLYDAGDLRGAAASYRKAMAAAQAFIQVGHSDEHCYHAYFLAGCRLAGLQASQGRCSPAFIERLGALCQEALVLDPTQPELQDDWVTIIGMKIVRQRELGRDAGPDLDADLAYLNTWAREPLTVELRAHRMLTHWFLAQRSLARGEDPGPDLDRALKDLGHTASFLHRDYLGNVLNFKARVEMHRGQDPRPTLDDVLARMGPLLERQVSWTTCETLAETWCLRADWEAAQGLDPRASLQRSLAMTGWALQINPRSAAAQALKGLAEVLEARCFPRSRRTLLDQAREQCRLALALHASGRLQAGLQKALDADPSAPPASLFDIKSPCMKFK